MLHDPSPGAAGREWLFAEGEMVCMMCFQPSRDGKHVSEYDMQTGETWHYCKPCDCWTSHPPKERADGE